ncbi:MAG: carbohydrate-binding protein, partial [Hymenobacter sp.]|nr:carbohydrate-binding protein [Hymenobacter sp.]
MQALAPGLSWWYNWYSKPDTGVAGTYAGLGVEYVPMQWGRSLDGADFTADRLAANIPAGAKYLLGFNEPNFRSQANLTPTQAAALWPTLQEVARRKNLKLVSPAVNYCGDCVSENGVTYYSPTQYLDAFFAACPTCQVDYIAVHTYVCEERYLREKIAELRKYNKPIWLTEFSCGDMPAAQITLDVQKKYLTDAVNYLENEPAVFRYAWFSGRNNEIPFINLLGNSGQLTTLGQLYVSLPAGGGAAAGIRLEAENYSNMQGVQVQNTTDTGGGQIVAFIDAGDWLMYNNINFPTSGAYTVEYRVASPNGGTLSSDLNGGSIQLGSMPIPATGGWQNWRTVTQPVNVTAGTYSFGITARTGGLNITWLR